MEDDHAIDDYYGKQSDNHTNHNADMQSNHGNPMPAPMAMHHPGSGMMNGPSPMMMGARGGMSRSPFNGPMGGEDRGDMHALGHTAPATISTTSAYVGNLHPTTTKEDLMNHFGSCGNLRRVTIPLHPSGQVRGCGYVEFESPEGLNRAIQLHNSILKGNSLEVYAKRDTHRRGVRGRGGAYGPRGAGMYGGPIPMFMPQYGISPYPMPSYNAPMNQGPMGGMRPWGGRGHRGGPGAPPPSGPYHGGQGSPQSHHHF